MGRGDRQAFASNSTFYVSQAGIRALAATLECQLSYVVAPGKPLTRPLRHAELPVGASSLVGAGLTPAEFRGSSQAGRVYA